jgi:F-type H+-transporting ATPase subunit g
LRLRRAAAFSPLLGRLKGKKQEKKMTFALVMRRSGLVAGRRVARFESTSSTTKQAAEAAKQAAAQSSSTASETTSKAAQGLSRVTSAAGPAIAKTAKGVSSALSRVGGRTGRLIAFVERKQDPTPASHIHLPPNPPC